MTADHNYTPQRGPTIPASLFRMVDVSPGPGKCGPGVPKPLAPQFLSSSGCLLPSVWVMFLGPWHGAAPPIGGVDIFLVEDGVLMLKGWASPRRNGVSREHAGGH